MAANDEGARPSPAAVPVFVDSSVVFAAAYGRGKELGGANPRGASLTLFQLGQARIVKLIICPLVIEEVRGAMQRKAPQCLALMDSFIALSTHRTEDARGEAVSAVLKQVAHPEDAPVLAGAVASGARFLVTLNPRHFPESLEGVQVLTPGALIVAIRHHLLGLAPLSL